MKHKWIIMGICIILLLMGIAYAADCPANCKCLTAKDAKVQNMVPCEEQMISCGKTKTGEALYCFRNNTTQMSIITGTVIKPLTLVTISPTATPTRSLKPTPTPEAVTAVKTLSPEVMRYLIITNNRNGINFGKNL